MGRAKKILSLVCVFSLSLIFIHKARGEIQTIRLMPGWNLISLQVNPTNNSVDIIPDSLKNPTTHATDSAAFSCIWAYDAQSGRWLAHHAGSLKINSVTIHLETIKSFQGYWIKVSRYVDLAIEGAPATCNIEFVEGWNLVGLGSYADNPDQLPTLNQFFGANLEKVPQMWMYDAENSQSFKGYDPHHALEIYDINNLEQGKGYWVYADTAFNLSPQLRLSLPPDINLAPFDNFPGTEDSDFDGDGQYDRGFEQRTMSFGETIVGERLIIQNEGSGDLNWQIASETPWLDFASYQGTTSDETDMIDVKVIRDGLLPGAYEGRFSVIVAGITEYITVKMTVPPLQGDYKGFARIEYVNGKPADLANVDLYVSLYVDEDEVSGLPVIKGVLNADKTVLFPIDFAILGCNYLQQSNQFVFKGGYRLPPADIDNPPFNPTPHEEDIDWNNNGKFDRINPYPFEIEREITLIGDRVADTVLEGKYSEVIKNALPYPIHLQGTFSIERIEVLPRKYTPLIYNIDHTINGIGTDCLCGRCGAGGIKIPDNDSAGLQDIQEIEDNHIIDEMDVWVKICHRRASDLTVSLISPAGTEVILHQGQAGDNIDTEYDTFTDPVGSFDVLRGESSEGEWKLKIVDSVGETDSESVDGYLVSWGLKFIKDQVEGLVVDKTTGNPIEDATVVLNGTVIVQSGKTDSNGKYHFAGLTAGRYIVSVSKLGYEDNSATLWISKGYINIPDISLMPKMPSEEDKPEFLAAPSYGTSPLTVTFAAITPDTINNPQYIWDFGDGESEETTVNTITHIYNYVENTVDRNQSGLYTVRLTVMDGETQIEAKETKLIMVVPTPSVSMQMQEYIYQYSFSGGGMEGGAFSEYMADMATFNIDRPPYGNFPGDEDTEEFRNIPEEQKFGMTVNIGAPFAGRSVMGDKVLSVGVIAADPSY